MRTPNTWPRATTWAVAWALCSLVTSLPSEAQAASSHPTDLAEPELSPQNTSEAAGAPNEAHVLQSMSLQRALIVQSGAGNWASIVQSGAGGDLAVISQSGTGNRASIVQR